MNVKLINNIQRGRDNVLIFLLTDPKSGHLHGNQPAGLQLCSPNMVACMQKNATEKTQTSQIAALRIIIGCLPSKTLIERLACFLLRKIIYSFPSWNVFAGIKTTDIWAIYISSIFTSWRRARRKHFPLVCLV